VTTITFWSVDPSYWTIQGANLVSQDYFSSDTEAFVLSPVQLANMSYDKSSSMLYADKLSLTQTFNSNISLTASEFLSSAWTSNGWSDTTTFDFKQELENFVRKNWGANTDINQFDLPSKLVFFNYSYSGTPYTVAVLFYSSQGEAMLPPGTILQYSGSAVPSGYLLCDGSPISRTSYSELFAAIGVTHGSGDGSTTFNLPDYRGQFMRGAMPTTLNSISGSGTVSSNNATFNNHGINRTGMKVRLNSGTITGLATSTTYYAIVVNSNTLAFATSLANSIAGTKIAISGTNSGVIGQYEDPDTRSAFTVGASSSGLGSSQVDQMQGHAHTWTTYYIFNAVGTALGANMQQATNPQTRITDSTLASDGTNGTPRTGQETRPQNVSVNYIIKF
jgi:microcystin-dependent protein